MYDYIRYSKDTDFVMHFRISTQGGVNKQCCHPFPLSRKMDDLKCTRAKSKIGIAHNGIIDLTTEYGYTAKATITYSDTMKFITDYLSLIIKDRFFYKDDDMLELIARLADSKLAIMDETGHTTLIGEFEKCNGVYYSNEYYKTERYRRAVVRYTTVDKEDDDKKVSPLDQLTYNHYPNINKK
jgi:predicted glutamine amidotransferase